MAGDGKSPHLLRHSPCLMINQGWVTWCVYSVFGSFILRTWFCAGPILDKFYKRPACVHFCCRLLVNFAAVLEWPLRWTSFSRGAPPNDPGLATHCSSCRKPSTVKRTKIEGVKWGRCDGKIRLKSFCFLRSRSILHHQESPPDWQRFFVLHHGGPIRKSSRDVNTLEILCFWNYMGGVDRLSI